MKEGPYDCYARGGDALKRGNSDELSKIREWQTRTATKPPSVAASAGLCATRTTPPTDATPPYRTASHPRRGRLFSLPPAWHAYVSPTSNKPGSKSRPSLGHTGRTKQSSPVHPLIHARQLNRHRSLQADETCQPVPLLPMRSPSASSLLLPPGAPVPAEAATTPSSDVSSTGLAVLTSFISSSSSPSDTSGKNSG